MTVLAPELQRSRRVSPSHAYAFPVVRELPPAPAAVPGTAW